MSINPIQKLGSEMLAKERKLIAWSRRERGLSAAAMPSGSAIARVRTKLTPIKIALRPNGAASAASAGRT